MLTVALPVAAQISFVVWDAVKPEEAPPKEELSSVALLALPMATGGVRSDVRRAIFHLSHPTMLLPPPVRDFLRRVGAVCAAIPSALRAAMRVLSDAPAAAKQSQSIMRA